MGTSWIGQLWTIFAALCQTWRKYTWATMVSRILTDLFGITTSDKCFWLATTSSHLKQVMFLCQLQFASCVPISYFAVQNQLGRNCPALELLSLGENPLTSISEYSGGLQKLFSLNLNITRIPDWSDLDKLREYPSLTELRIKHCPVLEEYTAHERRMMLVARLPNIQVHT